MKRPTMLYQLLLEDLGMQLDLSVERDVATLLRRYEHEGESFLSITLPTLSDSLERGLEDGRLSCPTAFRRHGRLPRFLGGFFSRVFNRAGELLPEPCIGSILAIRQICRFFKKLKIGCSPARELEAIRRYKAVEDELRVMTPLIERKDDVLDKVARIIWSQVFPELDPNDIVCHHGPGVTADRSLSNERRRIRNWYTRSELFFPSDLHAFHNYGAACGQWGEDSGVEGLNYWDIRDEPGVRVVFVPKTATGPRVIAIEPSSMQYMQQGLLEYIVPRLESHRLTCKSLRFSDQTENRRLAHQASIDQSLATLDLKDASDRVHFLLVRRIFSGSGILDYLEAARSLHATLPNGDNLILNKFASMGSAICFPVEAMVFYTLIQSAMHHQDAKRPSSSSIRQYSRRIAVYGDDIIVPVRYTDAVMTTLESFGLRVNAGKSFRFSHFRESCGGDYYKGDSVKPVYARQPLPNSRHDWTPEHVMSWVATADQLYEAGLWKATQFVRDQVEGALRTRIPRATVKGPGVYFQSLMFNTGMRYNPQACGWQQRRVVYQPILRKDDIDGNATACFNRSLFPAKERGSGRSTNDSFESTSGSIGSFGIDFGPSLDSCGRRPEGLGRESRTCDNVDAAGRVKSSICGLPRHNEAVGTRTSQLRSVCDGNASSDAGYRLTVGKSAIDFSSSAKRGAFRLKRRWITTLS